MQHTIEAVLARHAPQWMALAGVVGAGLTELDGAPAIVVQVQALTPALAAALPSALEGYPVTVQAVGQILPLGGRA
ncbi:hypothetical protein [Duganella hordei]|uniref:hypothetical protein n=1 Tax=Duganella hordei TaxID=2865934 RepID=UPI0030E8D7A7